VFAKPAREQEHRYRSAGTGGVKSCGGVADDCREEDAAGHAALSRFAMPRLIDRRVDTGLLAGPSHLRQ